MAISAALVHSYCLYIDGTRLTSMSETSIDTAAALLKSGAVDYLIISAAYDCWQQEAKLKIKQLVSLGVSPKRVKVIKGITDSYNEVRKANVLIKRLKIRELTVVAEEWHAPRAFAAARRCFIGLRPGIKKFTTHRFERAYEPHRIKLLGWIKSVRAGSKPLWIMWNVPLRYVDFVLAG